MPVKSTAIRREWMDYLCDSYSMEPFEAEVIFADIQLNLQTILHRLQQQEETAAGPRIPELTDALRRLGSNPPGGALKPVCEALLEAHAKQDTDALQQAVANLQSYCRESGCEELSTEDIQLHEAD